MLTYVIVPSTNIYSNLLITLKQFVQYQLNELIILETA